MEFRVADKVSQAAGFFLPSGFASIGCFSGRCGSIMKLFVDRGKKMGDSFVHNQECSRKNGGQRTGGGSQAWPQAFGVGQVSLRGLDWHIRFAA